MNWIKNVIRPRIRRVFQKKETPGDLWRKCPSCGSMIFHRDLEQAFNVCTTCGHHMRLAAPRRLELLLDPDSWEIEETPEAPLDPLGFRDQRRYRDRIKEAREKTGQRDAVLLARGRLTGLDVVLAVQDFSFMGGSLGAAAGEAIIAGAQTALADAAPYIMVTAAGGARMQEGILSLMQLPRTTVAIQSLRRAGLPYIVILTHPTTGGVTASYGMLGDVHIAEPGALIGFAGPRVIEQTIRQKLPEGFQSSEYLLEHGMVDMVVPRAALRAKLAGLLRLLLRRPAWEAEGATASPLSRRA